MLFASLLLLLLSSIDFLHDLLPLCALHFSTTGPTIMNNAPYDSNIPPLDNDEQAHLSMAANSQFMSFPTSALGQNPDLGRGNVEIFDMDAFEDAPQPAEHLQPSQTWPGQFTQKFDDPGPLLWQSQPGHNYDTDFSAHTLQIPEQARPYHHLGPSPVSDSTSLFEDGTTQFNVPFNRDPHPARLVPSMDQMSLGGSVERQSPAFLTSTPPWDYWLSDQTSSPASSRRSSIPYSTNASPTTSAFGHHSARGRPQHRAHPYSRASSRALSNSPAARPPSSASTHLQFPELDGRQDQWQGATRRRSVEPDFSSPFPSPGFRTSRMHARLPYAHRRSTPSTSSGEFDFHPPRPPPLAIPQPSHHYGHHSSSSGSSSVAFGSAGPYGSFGFDSPHSMSSASPSGQTEDFPRLPAPSRPLPRSISSMSNVREYPPMDDSGYSVFGRSQPTGMDRPPRTFDPVRLYGAPAPSQSLSLQSPFRFPASSPSLPQGNAPPEGDAFWSQAFGQSDPSFGSEISGNATSFPSQVSVPPSHRPLEQIVIPPRSASPAPAPVHEMTFLHHTPDTTVDDADPAEASRRAHAPGKKPGRKPGVKKGVKPKNRR